MASTKQTGLGESRDGWQPSCRPLINKALPVNEDYNEDPNIKALKRRGLINDGSTLTLPMIHTPRPFKGLNIRIPVIIPTKGRWFINQGSGLLTVIRIVVWGRLYNSCIRIKKRKMLVIIQALTLLLKHGSVTYTDVIRPLFPVQIGLLLRNSK